MERLLPGQLKGCHTFARFSAHGRSVLDTSSLVNCVWGVWVLLQEQRYDETESLYEDSLVIRQRFLQTESRDVAASFNSLGRLAKIEVRFEHMF